VLADLQWDYNAPLNILTGVVVAFTCHYHSKPCSCKWALGSGLLTVAIIIQVVLSLIMRLKSIMTRVVGFTAREQDKKITIIFLLKKVNQYDPDSIFWLNIHSILFLGIILIESQYNPDNFTKKTLRNLENTHSTL
jgi:hypothetical protein